MEGLFSEFYSIVKCAGLEYWLVFKVINKIVINTIAS